MKRENVVKYISSQKKPYLKTFRELVKIKPQMISAGDEATFDLTNCYIEGGLHFPEIKFAKTSGGWHVIQQ